MNLKEKLNSSEKLTISNTELAYMLENIGHPDAELRDETIYALFGEAFYQNAFSLEQVTSLYQEVMKRQLLFYHSNQEEMSYELVRSFSSLLLALIVFYDNNDDSIYQGVLDDETRNQIFRDAIKHISQEPNAHGYLKEFGWVHSIAHAAELLLRVVQHSMYPQSLNKDLLAALTSCFTKQKQLFSDAEEKRIGLVLTSMIKHNKLSLKAFEEWLDALKGHYNTLDTLSVATFRSQENLVNMLNDMNVYLDDENFTSTIKTFRTIYDV